jgi:copper resistance protein D
LDEPVIAARALHFGASIVVFGVLLFHAFVLNPAYRDRTEACLPRLEAIHLQMVWIVWIALALATVSAAAWVAVLAARIGGESLAEAFSAGTLWLVLTETRFGQSSLVRLALAVVLAAVLAWMDRDADRWRRLAWIPAVVAAGLIGGLAWSGHAGAAPGPVGSFQLVADVLHLAAAGAWLGGLLPLMLLLAKIDPDTRAGLARAVSRFSTLGVTSVGTLLATGVVNVWVVAAPWSSLPSTDYGQLLMLKLVLFAAMGGLAAVNRLQLSPRLDDDIALSRLRRNVVLEIILGFIIIGIVSILGVLPPMIAPAGHSH